MISRMELNITVGNNDGSLNHRFSHFQDLIIVRIGEIHWVADELGLAIPESDLVRHARRGDDYACVVFVFQSLSEDVHVECA